MGRPLLFQWVLVNNYKYKIINCHNVKNKTKSSIYRKNLMNFIEQIIFNVNHIY